METLTTDFTIGFLLTLPLLFILNFFIETWTWSSKFHAFIRDKIMKDTEYEFNEGSTSSKTVCWATPKKQAIKTMQTPGLTIPTPMLDKHEINFDDSDFLPDNFKAFHKENVLFNSLQVQVMVDEAVAQAKLEWALVARKEIEQEFQGKLIQVRKECELNLEEHGKAWEDDHHELVEQIKSQMEIEKLNLSNQHEHILKDLRIEHDSRISELQLEIDELQKISDLRISCLENELMDVKSNFDTLVLERERKIEILKEKHSTELKETKQDFQIKLESETKSKTELAIMYEETIERLRKDMDTQKQCQESEQRILAAKYDELKERCDVEKCDKESIEKTMNDNQELHDNDLNWLIEELNTKHQEEILLIHSENSKLMEHHNSKFEILQSEINVLNEIIENLQTELRESGATVEKLSLENKALHETMKESNTQADGDNDSRQNEAKEKNEHLQRDIESLQTKVGLLEEAMEREKALYAAQLQFKEQEMIDKISLVTTQFESEKDHLLSRESAHALDLNTKVEKISQLEGKLILLESEIRDLSRAKTDAVEKLENERTEFHRSRADLISLHKEEMNEILVKFGNERMQLQDDGQRQISELIRNHQADLDNVRQELTSKLDREDLSIQSENSKLLEDSKLKIELLHSEVNVLNETNENLRTELKESGLTIETLSHMHDESKERIQLLEKEIEALQLNVGRMEQTIESEKALYMAQLEAKEQELIDKMTQLESEKELSSLKSATVLELNTKVERIAELEGKLILFESEIRDLTKARADLVEQLENERIEFQRSRDDLISSQKAEMDEAKAKFDAEQILLEGKLKETTEKYNCVVQEKEGMFQEVEEESRNFDLRLNQIREEHNSQIDEMLCQLDLVEAEHHERYNSLEKLVVEKDAIISALGTQLADSQHRTTKLVNENEAISRMLLSTEAQLNQAQEEITALQSSMMELREILTSTLEDERKKAIEQCEEVRNATIAVAEAQFNKANEHYMNLKHEYDSTIATNAKLEKEIRSLQRKVEEAKSEALSQEATMANELANSKAGK
jgi:hypothetical protein